MKKLNKYTVYIVTGSHYGSQSETSFTCFLLIYFSDIYINAKYE